MRFFLKPDPIFTHRGRLYGIPLYLNENGPEIMGTNVVFDWMLLWWPPVMHWVIDHIGVLLLGREPMPGFMLEVREPLS